MRVPSLLFPLLVLPLLSLADERCRWSWALLGCGPLSHEDAIHQRDFLCELSLAQRRCVATEGNPHKHGEVIDEGGSLCEDSKGRCGSSKGEPLERGAGGKSALQPLLVALDWTPNVNHAGLFVAKEEGLYEAAGLAVELQSPEVAGGVTPARQVAAGAAALAVAPSESAISFATSEPDKPRLRAVAAMLQGSTSAICALAGAGIDRPRDLEGKRYASYNGRFEDPIVRAMVRNDGGDGDTVKCHPLEMHGYADAATVQSGSAVASQLQAGKSDSTWIFTQWEGVLAQRAGQDLRCFHLEDYGIPYGYSPVLLAHPDMIANAKGADILRRFLAATAEGYKRAAADPAAAAAAIVASGHPSVADAAFVHAAAEATADRYLTTEGTWGAMHHERWARFLGFLASEGILTDRQGVAIEAARVDVAQLFTNELLQ